MYTFDDLTFTEIDNTTVAYDAEEPLFDMPGTGLSEAEKKAYFRAFAQGCNQGQMWALSAAKGKIAHQYSNQAAIYREFARLYELEQIER